MTTLAEAECRRHGWAFPEVFRNQYLIAPAAETVPRSWRWKSRAIGNWRISHCPRLPLAELVLSDGKPAALVLGIAVTPEGMVLEGRVKLAVNARSPKRVTEVEAFIAGLAGRYVALVCLGRTERIYPDPVCGLGPVWHAGAKRIGASTALAIDREVIDNPEVPADDVAAGRARYLFGHTADAEVRRAISNHYLDLADFSQHRHWPADETSFGLDGRPHRELAVEIGEKLGRNVAALAGRFPTALPVTGGTDSRLLLAAGCGSLDRIGQFFVYHTNWANSVDTEIARELAQTLCLPLTVISRAAPPFREAFTKPRFRAHMAQRRLRGGFEPESAEKGSIRAMALLPEDMLILRGNVAEMTRALRWHRSVYDDPHNTAFALEKLDVLPEASARYDHWADCLETWKAGLPERAVPRLYDLLHTELWLPHTNSAVYIRDLRHFLINPFNDRHLIHLTATIPPMIRKKRRTVNDIVYANARDIWRTDYIADRLKRRAEDRAA